jgi:hypothetical protein
LPVLFRRDGTAVGPEELGEEQQVPLIPQLLKYSAHNSFVVFGCHG